MGLIKQKGKASLFELQFGGFIYFKPIPFKNLWSSIQLFYLHENRLHKKKIKAYKHLNNFVIKIRNIEWQWCESWWQNSRDINVQVLRDFILMSNCKFVMPFGLKISDD